MRGNLSGAPRHARHDYGDFVVESGTEGRGHQVSVQSAIYNHIADSSSHNPWPPLLKKRIKTLAPNIVVGDMVESTQRLAKVLIACGPTRAMCVIKTLTNSWITTDRVQEGVRLNCIFGCEALDCQTHYMQCEPLWTILTSCAGLGVDWLGVGLDTRLGMCNPSRTTISLLVVAHRAYHRLRMEYPQVVNDGQRDEGIDRLHELFRELCCLFWAEAIA